MYSKYNEASPTMFFIGFLYFHSNRAGGKGRVKTDWLDSMLTENANVKFKLVFGHHPVYPVNEFSGDFQRNLEPENGKRI